MDRKTRKQPLPTIGWREWVALPLLNINRVKAKVDSGARSSSLHAFDIEPFQRDDAEWVQFSIHPLQRNNDVVVIAEAPVHDQRPVRSSSGHLSLRYVIMTSVQWKDVTWTIELTLADRDPMGFRMLLGREAVRRRFVVDPSRSYLGGRRDG